MSNSNVAFSTSERTSYRRQADGEFVPLATAENVPAGTKFAGGVNFRTATPDLSDAVIVSPQTLSLGFKAGFDPEGRQSVYELSSIGSFTLISVLPSGQPAAEAGLIAGVGIANLRGVIASDGDRVVFGAGEDLYLRDLPRGQTLRLGEPQVGAKGGEGAAEFQAANSDASRILFTDASRLTSDSTAKLNEPDLYMCEVEEDEGQLACALSDLSVDHNSGEAANVVGKVSAIDETGAHVYFAADGVLASTPNARGEVPVPGACEGKDESICNVYEYNTDTHQLSLVAVLSSRDDPDWAGRTNLRVLGNLTTRSSPNGRYFTFMSRRPLTGYDNRDARSGQPDEEVFQLDSSSGKLSCVSCNPTGARPNGVFDKDVFPGLLVDHPRSWRERWLSGSTPGWTLGPSLSTALYQSRYLSNSGREFFNSSDALVPQDTNNVNDVYEFEPPGVGDCSTTAKTYSPTSGGCVALISSGGSRKNQPS